MKSLKNILLVLVSALPLLAHARGGESGGGGAQIESAFRIRARDLISQIDHNSAANALCSSQVLLAALDNTDIRVVDKLAGATHDGSFDAWTVPGSAGKPGKMQLLKSSWDGFVNNTSATFAGHSVDILILHEVYRATQSCNDERFVLSDQIPALLGSFHNSDNFQVCTQATQKAASACSYERGTYDAISREVAQGQLPAGSDDPAHAALNNCYANLTSRCFMANSGANLVEGDYSGMLTSVTDGGPIAGIRVHVEKDIAFIGTGSASEGESMAVLKLTVTLDDGTQTSTLVFEKGALDPEAMQFSATSSVANRGAAQMVGTFGSNGLLTGNLEAEGYPERGGSFVLTLNAPIPSLQGVKTRASEENKFLFNSFSGQGNFATPQNPPTSPVSTTPDKNVHLVTMRQASTQVQNFMDIITSYRTLDASIYLSWTDSSGFGHNNGAIFQNSVWDSRAKTLTGTYSVPATGISQGTELKLSCSQSGMGWNCTQTSLMAGVLFTVTFMPDPAH